MSLTAETNPAIIHWGHPPCALHSAQKRAMFCIKSKHGPFSLLRGKDTSQEHRKNTKYFEFEILQFVNVYEPFLPVCL